MQDSNIVSLEGCDTMSVSDVTSRFNEIYDATNKYILAFITAKCKNTSDINDIFQDTYMELYKILDKHGADYVKNDKIYVYRIAKHQISRHYSLTERLRMFVSMTFKSEENENEEVELSEKDIDSILMEDYVVNQIMLENVQKFIEQKSSDIEKIFNLFYNVGLPISEIAKELSLSESNVKNKLYRTVKELRDLLKKGGSDNESL